jgi:Cu/Ag efflux protein CusF
MAFSVKDKAVLDKLAKDKKVDFEFKEQGKDYVITDVK